MNEKIRNAITACAILGAFWGACAAWSRAQVPVWRVSINESGQTITVGEERFAVDGEFQRRFDVSTFFVEAETPAEAERIARERYAARAAQ